MSDASSDKIARFGGRMAMAGFGSIGQGVLPLLDRGLLFKEDLDEDDPRQFKDFRVV